jgi:CubicO group peptidase (beta-lactamase class C family)
MRPIFCTLLLILPFFGESQTGHTAEVNNATLTALINEFVPADGPGLAVQIMRGDNLLYVKGFGKANVEHDIPFTPSTVSDLGSVAKQFTAFAIALLADEGKLDLDADIRTFFPEAPDFGKPVTVRHMVHHTSGLREIYSMKAMAGNPRSGISQFEAQELLTYSEELNFEPGERWLYCNTSYMLLADIVEQVSGQSFEAFMQERIFRPLGMKDTYIMDVQGETFPDRADSYRQDADYGWVQVYDVSSAYGQGGIYSSLHDLAKWVGNFRTRQIGTDAVHELIRTSGTLNNGESTGYGFGLFVEDWRGVPRLSHGGSSAGYRSYVAYFPEQQLQIIAKGNWTGMNSAGIVNALAERLLADALDAPVPRERSREVTEEEPYTFSGDLQRYVGRYYAPELDVYCEIVAEDEQLYIKNRLFGMSELQPVADHEFFAQGVGLLRFQQKNNKVTEFRLDEGRVLNLRFDRQ